MKKKDSFKTIAFLFFICFLPSVSYGEADGPDYYSTPSRAVALRDAPSLEGNIIIYIPGNTPFLRKNDCKGGLGMELFTEAVQKMDLERLENASNNTWCSTRYLGKTGWVLGKHLGENPGPDKPTFDCDKAIHAIEKLICKDLDLIYLDHLMDSTYRKALQILKNDKDFFYKSAKHFRTSQRGWIKGRNECWKSDDKKGCTTSSYHRKIAALQAEFGLGTLGDTVSYSCEYDGTNKELRLTYYETSTLETIAIEYGGEDITMIASTLEQNPPKKYDGDFGGYLILNEDTARFVPREFLPELVCKSRERKKVQNTL